MSGAATAAVAGRTAIRHGSSKVAGAGVRLNGTVASGLVSPAFT